MEMLETCFRNKLWFVAGWAGSASWSERHTSGTEQLSEANEYARVPRLKGHTFDVHLFVSRLAARAEERENGLSRKPGLNWVGCGLRQVIRIPKLQYAHPRTTKKDSAYAGAWRTKGSKIESAREV